MKTIFPAAALAAATSAVLLAGTLALFHHAAPEVWLPASPALLARVEACDRLPARTERERCARQAVASFASQRQVAQAQP